MPQKPKKRIAIPISAGLTAPVLADTLTTLPEKGRFFTFVNPHAFNIAKRYPAYLTALEEFDGILCDGIGLVTGARLLGIKGISRISFDSTSLAPRIFRACVDNSLSLFFIGGSEGIAHQAACVIRDSYPDIQIVGTATGYIRDPQLVVDEIKASGASVVICGMGAPRQETFLLTLKRSGWKGFAFTCGGYFDQLSNGFNYYPRWVDALNIRFLYRIYREPQRLVRRYALEYLPFLLAIARGLLTPASRRLSPLIVRETDLTRDLLNPPSIKRQVSYEHD